MCHRDWNGGPASISAGGTRSRLEHPQLQRDSGAHGKVRRARLLQAVHTGHEESSELLTRRVERPAVHFSALFCLFPRRSDERDEFRAGRADDLADQLDAGIEELAPVRALADLTHQPVEMCNQGRFARLRALVSGDIETALALHADDFQLITPIGVALSRSEYLGAIASGQIDYVHWEPGSIDIRLHEDTAAIRYRAELEVVFGGHPVPRAGHWHTDLYERTASGWQVVWSQATQIR